MTATQETTYVIETEKLGYQVGNQKLLSDISFKVKQGEHWLVYGMNGCGKTTLFSILAGYRQQTEGNLRVLGETFNNENILAQRKKIAFVSSSFFDTRYRHERVKDIVLSGLFGTYGLDWNISAKEQNKAQHLLEKLNLGNKVDLSYDRLSKGQRQNVLIARAFMSKPEILLLDEPCSGLDVLAKAHFMELLKELMQQENLTVLYVSHEVSEVKDLFPHTLLLRNGRVFSQGETEKLFVTETLTTFLQHQITVGEKVIMDILPRGQEGKLSVHDFYSK